MHIDTKKLGRIVCPSHRVTGNRRDSVDGAGWEALFVAIDDPARIAFTGIHPDEKKQEAVVFQHNAVAYYAGLGGASNVCCPTTAQRSFRGHSLQPARHWASRIGSRGRTGRKIMARSNGSSSRHCASGPMAGPTRTQASERWPSPTGSTISTGIDHTAA